MGCQNMCFSFEESWSSCEAFTSSFRQIFKVIVYRCREQRLFLRLNRTMVLIAGQICLSLRVQKIFLIHSAKFFPSNPLCSFFWTNLTRDDALGFGMDNHTVAATVHGQGSGSCGVVVILAAKDFIEL